MGYQISKMALVVFLAGIPLFVENASYADAARDAYADGINNMSNDAVWNAMLGSGIGKCRIAVGTSGQTACHYYFVSSSTSLNQGSYNGLPIYNTDNSNTACYAGSPTASRVTAKTTQRSTGCLPTPGGLWGSSTWYQWGGINSNEQTTDMKQFVHDMAVTMIKDSADPCEISSLLSSAETSLPVQSMNLASIKFASSAGVAVPTKCYIAVTGHTLPVAATFAGTVVAAGTQMYAPITSAVACQFLFNRIAFGGTNLNLVGSTLAAGTPAILTAAQAALASEVPNLLSKPALATAIGSTMNATRITALASLPIEQALVATPALVGDAQRVTFINKILSTTLTSAQITAVATAVKAQSTLTAEHIGGLVEGLVATPAATASNLQAVANGVVAYPGMTKDQVKAVLPPVVSGTPVSTAISSVTAPSSL